MSKRAQTPEAEPLPTPETLTQHDEQSGGTQDHPTAFDPRVFARRFQPSFPGNLRFCFLNLRDGCYRISLRSAGGSFFINDYKGTMRVDRAAGPLTISGDLYRFPRFRLPSAPGGLTISPAPRLSPFVTGGVIGSTGRFFFPRPKGIPIYPRGNYYSYLKVVNVQTSPILTTGPCNLTLTIDEYVYNRPASGFNGTFPSTPSRRLTAVLSPAAAPSGFTSSYFEGKLFEGAREVGVFSMGWVSSRFRRATLEVDTLQGALAPQPVPAASGSGNEDFRTIFATAGWDLSVSYDQTNIATPSGVTANACWSSANLHGLMAAVRKAGTNLDQEWRTHLVVVPATLGCSRGVMYDQIGVHHEGSASFSHDGYPSTTSTNFGSAADRRQHEVPRAFLRSAAHEVGHAFNQVHQEAEGGADNSVMTTTPSVANVLAGPASGAPGVFPNNIDLSFNAHVRHHLVHLPDPAVRPGAMNWATSHTTTVPESDLDAFLVDSSEVELRISTSEQRVKLGQPLRVTWQVINQSNRPLGLPTDLSLEAGHARIYVLDPSGKEKDVGPFAVHGEETHLADLASGGQLKAEANLFWSSASGFIFDTPGPHRIDLRLVWFSEAGPRALKSSAEVFVDYPTSAEDNEVASLLMDPEVGMAVALGGGASHLKRGKSRMEKAISAHPSHAACKCMEPYARTASGRKAKGKPAGG